MIKRALYILFTLTVSISCTACGSSSKTSFNENSSDVNLQELESGHYYVQNKDTLLCEELYFGKATFDQGDISDSQNDKRVMWFKEDYEKIPTLYAGDSLIMYSDDVFDEEFHFERFRDEGYTIGICGMQPTVSGRYSISTDVDDKCTYPDGDTDVILTYPTEYVIIDKIGSIKIRQEEKKKMSTEEDYTGMVSNIGTLRGLTKDQEYTVEVYGGTKIHDSLQFKANVRALGSFETCKSNKFDFGGDKNIINITIPDNFNTGFYMINGMGMFRYVNGSYYDEASTNFNYQNEYVLEDEDNPVEISPELSDLEDYNDYIEEFTRNSTDIRSSSFNVDTPGELDLEISFKLKEGYSEDGDGLETPSAIITTPSGRSIQMNEAEDHLYLKFNATETGQYTITYYNLNARNPVLNFLEEGSTVE